MVGGKIKAKMFARSVQPKSKFLFLISLDFLAHLPPFFAQVDIHVHYFLSFMTMRGVKIGV